MTRLSNFFPPALQSLALSAPRRPYRLLLLLGLWSQSNSIARARHSQASGARGKKYQTNPLWSPFAATNRLFSTPSRAVLRFRNEPNSNPFRPASCYLKTMQPPANPFSDPLRFERRVPECAIVIFGANGDLTKRKLLPALYRLALDRRLPESFSIIGNSRTPMNDDAFRQKMRESVQKFSEDTPLDDDLWTRFARNIHYVGGDMNDPALYAALSAKAAEAHQ